MRVFYIFLVAFCLAFATACGGGSDDSGGTPDAQDDVQPQSDAGPGDDASTTYPAFSVDAPQVENLGGSVLATPKVQPVFFPGFDYATQLTDFTSKIGASSFWAALSEYNVGAITSLTPITLTTNDVDPSDYGTITDAQIQTWLKSRFDGTHPEWGTPDPHVIYALFYPTSSVIYLGGGGGGDGGAPDAGGFGGSKSCQSFGGYHAEVQVQSTVIPYAVLPECPTFGNLTGVNVVTATTSHELSEAATDPLPDAVPAYFQVDDDHIAWELFLGGGEVGDMCAQFPDSFYQPTDFAYTVQRNWSNQNAKAGHDPCQPNPSTQPYFNTVPIVSDSVTVRGSTTKGVNLPVGTPVTIELDLFSDAPTPGPWTVSAQAYSRSGPAPVTTSFDATQGQNGDKIHLTLTATAAFTGKSSKTATLLVTSQLGVRQTEWIAILGQP